MANQKVLKAVYDGSNNAIGVAELANTEGILAYGGGGVTSNFAAGVGALTSHATSGGNNVAIGNLAQSSDYANSDNVTIGANAGQNLSSGVSAYTVVAGGTGYVSGSATSTVSAPASGGTQATASLLISGGAILMVTPLVAGSKYDSTATITINPVGGGSGANVTTIVGAGSNNVAIGSQALKASVSSYEHVAVGFKALTSCTNYTLPNTAVGTRALTLLTSGNSNCALGYQAGSQITTANSTTSIGTNAGTNIGTYGTAVGMNAGNGTTSGGNTCLGYYSGYSAATNTTWVGQNSGQFNSGLGNVGVGYNVMSAYGTGAYNTGMGEQSLKAITTGSYNTGLGYKTLFAYTTQNYSTAVGYQSLIASTADKNTALGYSAGSNNTTGTNITCIGYNAQPIGASTSNEITLGDANISTLRCAAGTVTALSDARDKTDIKTLPPALEFISHLHPVSFTWNSRDGSKTGIKDSGFIAQELDQAQEAFGLTDYLHLVNKTNPDKLEASYGKLLPMMVRALQDLILENKALVERIELLESRNV